MLLDAMSNALKSYKSEATAISVKELADAIIKPLEWFDLGNGDEGAESDSHIYIIQNKHAVLRLCIGRKGSESMHYLCLDESMRDEMKVFADKHHRLYTASFLND